MGLTRISAAYLAGVLCFAPSSGDVRMKEVPMLSDRALALAVGLAALPQMVHAGEGAARRVDASVPTHAAEALATANGSN